MQFVIDDGGREAAGYKGKAGDCVARAIAITTQQPYDKVYKALAEGNFKQRASSRTAKQSKSARNGIYTNRKWFDDYMTSLGFKWISTMSVGSGCRVHLKPSELPQGRLIVKLSRHLAAVIDGVLRDTYDCSRDGTRCVYGYYLLKG